jgi:Flp pilus assembly protein TadD
MEMAAMMSLRGDSEVQKLNFDMGIAAYSIGLSFNTQSDALFNARGYAKLLKGDLKGAEGDFLRASQLNPENADARENLKSIKKKSGEGEV